MRKFLKIFVKSVKICRLSFKTYSLGKDKVILRSRHVCAYNTLKVAPTSEPLHHHTKTVEFALNF